MSILRPFAAMARPTSSTNHLEHSISSRSTFGLFYCLPIDWLDQDDLQIRDIMGCPKWTQNITIAVPP